MRPFTSKQQEIIKASFDIASRQGLNGLTTKNLAGHLHVTEPALYRHFRKKSDLLYVILCQMEERNNQAKAAYLGGNLSAPLRLEKMFLETAAMMEKNPTLASVMFSGDPFLKGKKLLSKVRDIQNATLRTISQILAEGIRQKQIRSDVSEEDVGLIIMGTMRLVIKRWQISGCRNDLIQHTKKTWRALKVLLKNGSYGYNQTRGRSHGP